MKPTITISNNELKNPPNLKTIENNLKTLQQQGVVTQISTCCNNGIFEDHDVTIKFQKKGNTVTVFQHSTMLGSDTQIVDGNMIYRKSVSDGSRMMKSLEAFLGPPQRSLFEEVCCFFSCCKKKKPPIKMEYTKVPIKNGKAEQEKTEKMSAEDFDQVLSSVPKEIQQVLTIRETGEHKQMVQYKFN